MTFNPHFEMERLDLPHPENYVFTPGLLNAQQCQDIVKEFDEKTRQWATVGNGQSFVEDLNYRSVQHTYIPMDEAHVWLYQRLKDEISVINERFWGFDIRSIGEEIQFLRYTHQNDVGNPGHYGWHQDFGGGRSARRKISVVINLTDPSEYDGCRLHGFTHTEFEVKEIQPGTMITFPSWLPHCVTPITRGTRHALVTWIHGPRFV